MGPPSINKTRETHGHRQKHSTMRNSQRRRNRKEEEACNKERKKRSRRESMTARNGVSARGRHCSSDVFSSFPGQSGAHVSVLACCRVPSFPPIYHPISPVPLSRRWRICIRGWCRGCRQVSGPGPRSQELAGCAGGGKEDGVGGEGDEATRMVRFSTSFWTGPRSQRSVLSKG